MGRLKTLKLVSYFFDSGKRLINTLHNCIFIKIPIVVEIMFYDITSQVLTMMS